MIESRVQNRSKWKSRLILLGAFIILVLVTINLAQGIQKNRLVNDEIGTLEKDIDDISQNNQELKKLIEYFNSNAYIEEKARIDLGLKKEGEQVVVISDLVEENKSNRRSQIKKLPADDTSIYNLKKWWQYFFK